jgi:hypothetical protein
VLILAPKDRVRRAENQWDTTMWWAIRRAVVRHTGAGTAVAMARPLGPDIRMLTASEEGISWCRGWSRESRDALAAAWKLYRSAGTGPTPT